MTKREQIVLSIEAAAQRIGTTWPLYSFVTSNPLSGYEKLPFQEAIIEAKKFLNSNTYPSAEVYEQALEKRDIDLTILSDLLNENQFYGSPEGYLKKMKVHDNLAEEKTTSRLDVIMSKWLAAFMDEGLAEWQMPFKEKGFYKAWANLAKYDNELGKARLKNLPKTSIEAIELVIEKHHMDSYNDTFSAHIAALAGWTGYIKHRLDTNSVWQQKFPITIEDYLAVRLTIADHLYDSLEVSINSNGDLSMSKLKYVWLKAWEKSFQNQLIVQLKKPNHTPKRPDLSESLDAQLVFCIDTRSELIRRHVEASGYYETFGYAGFFGITADYQHYQEAISIKSCPPIVESNYKIMEVPNEELAKIDTKFKKSKKFAKAKIHILKRLKNMLPSSFGFVEGSGTFYGVSLLAQSFFPNAYGKIKNRNQRDYESFCEPHISYNSDKHLEEISLKEKTAIVKSAFDLMGWTNFAPLIVFAGHGSHTSNNPFGSSLDCGACAASPGRHNARLLATLANDKAVRLQLKKEHQIEIPEATFFIGAEHNTTTDAIVLFDANASESHKTQIAHLKKNLKDAQIKATAERLNVSENRSRDLAKKKAYNWAETRPEWGLAKNAAFIIGSRDLTASMNLEGRCFLHSYDWQLDDDGEALAGIMAGPMVVTQWINNHYYFSTVDNQKFGSGSKITHNITGQFGVLQGNGGDLKMGLPLQSLSASDTEMYHQPLRLTTIIHAPLDRVERLLKANTHLQMLLDNEWMYLTVMDSKDSDQFKTYSKNYNWLYEDQDLARQNSKATPLGVI